jgi:uncharacterized Zn-binding protein involved in type VI secretion
MASSVGANRLSVVHRDSNGTTIAFPDVCKTPKKGGPVPRPYPNVAKSADSAQGTKTLKVDGKPICISSSNFSTSTGDEPGSAGGVVSGTVKGKAEFINCSFDVRIEGKGVARAFDLMLHNNKNTGPFPVIQGPVVATRKSADDCTCLICKKKVR